MARLRTILNEYELEKACENLHSYFRDIHERREDPKELLTLFPHLINKLFIDTNETVCWLKATKPSQINALTSLLSSKGNMFQVLITLSIDNKFRFEFPLSRLPAITRSLILTSKTSLLPPLYKGKLDDASTKVMLNIYEYYVFHFVWFATVVGRKDPDVEKTVPGFHHILNWTDNLLKAAHIGRRSLEFNVYLTLFEQYVSFFFPKPYTKTEVDSPSLKFVQVCIEFWLNQNGDNNKNYITPTLIQMTCTFTLLRNILDSVLIFDPNNFQTEFHEQYVKQSRVLLKLIQDVISKPLYHFLKQSFFYSYWKFDSQLLAKVVEIWLLYINPWKDFPKVSSNDKQRRLFTADALNYRQVLFAEHVKKPYIFQNFLFYVPILIRFLTMALDFDFRNVSSSKCTEIHLLHKVLVVFANPDILKIITEIEDTLNNTPQGTYRSNFEQTNSLRTQCFTVLEDNPYYQYFSLLHRRNVEVVEQLISVLKGIEMNQNKSPPSNDKLVPLTTLLKSNYLTQTQTQTPTPPQNQTQGPSQDLKQDKILSITELIELLCLIFKIPDNGAHIPLPSIHTNKERDDLKGDTFEDIFKPHMEGTKLSKIGKLQILKGQKLCTNKDVQFRGDDRLRPITSMEIAFLVRWLFVVSKFFEEKTGYYINLRPFAHYRNLTWLFFGFLCVYFLISLLFSLLSSNA